MVQRVAFLLCLSMLACGDDERAGDSGGDPRDENSLEGTPECDAWCARVDELDCPGGSDCGEDFFCRIDVEDGECAESKRAYLTCGADTAMFMCTETGWTAASNCELDNSVCP